MQGCQVKIFKSALVTTDILVLYSNCLSQMELVSVTKGVLMFLMGLTVFCMTWRDTSKLEPSGLSEETSHMLSLRIISCGHP